MPDGNEIIRDEKLLFRQIGSRGKDKSFTYWLLHDGLNYTIIDSNTASADMQKMQDENRRLAKIEEFCFTKGKTHDKEPNHFKLDRR